MQSQHAIDFIERLQLEFGKVYSDQNYAEFVGRISGHSRDLLDRAFDEIVRTCERLPAYAAIHKAMSSCVIPCASQARHVESKSKIDELISFWARDYLSGEENRRAIFAGIDWDIYKYSRAMAETQAHMIQRTNGPGYYDYDCSAVLNPAEYQLRKAWWMSYCESQAIVQQVRTVVPDYVFAFYLARQEKKS